METNPHDLENLLRQLGRGADNPTLTMVHKVLHAVGLRLSVVPAHA